jgi:hypothetical protein
MEGEPTFEDYLRSKKIDSDAFRLAEPGLWNAWTGDFQKSHPNSFTVQKLNLINPVRRKYHLALTVDAKPPNEHVAAPVVTPGVARPPRPVMNPKPKIDPGQQG